MKKLLKIVIVIAIIILILAIGVKIIGKGNDNSDDKMKEKIMQEMKYMDKEIVSMLNLMNNITFSNYKVIESNQNNKQDQNSNGSSQSYDQSTNTTSDNNTSSNTTSSDSGGGNTQSNNTSTSISMAPNTILNSMGDNNIDWETLKKDIEIMYLSWSTIVEDLYSEEINGDDILKFGNLFDTVIINIKNEDKINSMKNLASMYNMLPIFIEKISGAGSANIQYVKTIINKQEFDSIFGQDGKSLIINSYVLVEEDKWDDIPIQLDGAINYYTKMYDENKNDNTGYILLEELKKSIQPKDKELFYIKYKYCMETIPNYL